MRILLSLLLILALNFSQLVASESPEFLGPKEIGEPQNFEQEEEHDQTVTILPSANEIAAEATGIDQGEGAEDNSDASAQEEIVIELPPEFEAYKRRFRQIPNAPPDFKRIPLAKIRTDPTIMRSYASNVPIYLLKAISSHEKFKKSDDKEKRKEFLDRGFFPPGPYLLDLIYIFKKKVKEGSVFVFGVTTNQCIEKSCKGGYKCSYPSFFSTYEPKDGVGRLFLDFEVTMAPFGYMQCPSYII